VNHLSDVGIVKYGLSAFQNRVDCPHTTSRTFKILFQAQPTKPLVFGKFCIFDTSYHLIPLK